MQSVTPPLLLGALPALTHKALDSAPQGAEIASLAAVLRILVRSTAKGCRREVQAMQHIAAQWAVGWGEHSTSNIPLPAPDAFWAAGTACWAVGLLVAARKERSDFALLLPGYAAMLKWLAGACLSLSFVSTGLTMLAHYAGPGLAEPAPTAPWQVLALATGLRLFLMEGILAAFVCMLLQPAVTLASLRVAVLLSCVWAIPVSGIGAGLTALHAGQRETRAALGWITATQCLFAVGIVWMATGLRSARPALRPLAVHLLLTRTLQAAAVVSDVVPAACAPLQLTLAALYGGAQALGTPLALFLTLRSDTFYWRGMGRGLRPGRYTCGTAASGACCALGPLFLYGGLRLWGLPAILARGAFHASAAPLPGGRHSAGARAVAALAWVLQDASLRASLLKRQAAHLQQRGAAASPPVRPDTPSSGDEGGVAAGSRQAPGWGHLPGSDLASVLQQRMVLPRLPESSPRPRVTGILKSSSFGSPTPQGGGGEALPRVRTASASMDAAPTASVRDMADLRSALRRGPPVPTLTRGGIQAWLGHTARPAATGVGSVPSSTLSYLLGGVRAESKEFPRDALRDALRDLPPATASSSPSPAKPKAARARLGSAARGSRRRTRGRSVSSALGSDSGDEADDEARRSQPHAETSTLLSSADAVTRGVAGSGQGGAFSGARASLSAGRGLRDAPVPLLERAPACSENLIQWSLQGPGTAVAMAAYGGVQPPPGGLHEDWAQAEASDRAREEWDMMQSALESFACAWACLRLCPCWLWAFPCCTPRAFHACAGFGPSAEECDMPLLSDSAAMYLQNMLEECRDFLVPFSALEVHDLVAEGAEATVFHGLADDRPAAIKVFRAAHPGMFVDRIQEARTEARFCYTLDHPNLVKFYGLCVCPPDVALVSELCERGSLKKLLEVLHSEKRRLLARIRRSEPEQSPVHSTRHSQHGAHAQAKRVSMADLYLGHKAGLGAAGQGYYGITSDTLLVYEALQLLSSDRGKALLERSRMERSPAAAARAAGAEVVAATPGQEDTRKLFEALPAWILRLSLPPLQALASNVPIFAPHGLVPIPRSAAGADGEESLSPLPRHTLEALASRSRTTVSVFNVAVPSAGAGPACEPGAGAGNKQPLLQPPVRDNYGTKDAAEGLQAEVQVAELGAANVTENDLYYVCDLRVRLGMALHAASSLAYMHSLQSDDSPQVRFVHRDIKSPNFLVTDDFTLKLTDFGEAGPLAGGRRAVPQTGGRGTLVWCAPEVFQQAGVNRYSESVDIYSLGIVLWELLTGEEPFAQYQSPHALIAAVDSGKRPRIPKHTPGVLRSLIKRMWHAQPSQRPSALTVCQLLKKFLNRLNVEVERMFWLQKRIPSRLTAEQKVSIQRLIEAVE